MSVKNDQKNEFMDESHIYEPLGAYRNVFKENFNQNTIKYFEDLTKQAGTKIEENRETVKHIRKLDKEISKAKKTIGWLTFLKVMMIIFGIGGLAALVYGIILLTQEEVDFLLGAILIGGGILLIIGMWLLLTKTTNPALKRLKSSKAEKEAKQKEAYNLAWSQMKSLNDSFTNEMGITLFKQTVPLINIDEVFDSRRLDYLIRKFNLDELIPKDNSRSSLYIKSGDINGSPFFIADDLVHYLGTKTYVGTKTISWTTTRIVNGKTTTQRHTQTLRATVTKPCPYYHKEPYLVYGNEAAPDLIFSRQDSDAENMDQKKIDSHVNRQIKKLDKKSQKQTVKGGNYTVLANSEFEVLFNATDRNHEVQFRLLFTPLAQKQLLLLMKDKKEGFGDNFDFVKHKKINIIYPDNLGQIELNPSSSYFVGYDYDAVRERFITYHNLYFKHVYFTFAPILAIPLYQQTQPFEFIYKDLYDSYVSFYEHECVVNSLDVNQLKHELSSTNNILKTKVIRSANDCDTVRVSAHGYQTQPMTDFVNVRGGDGMIHSVAVNWTLYTPVVKQSEVDINVVNPKKELSPGDQIKAFFERIASTGKVDQKDIVQLGRYVAIIKSVTKSNK